VFDIPGLDGTGRWDEGPLLAKIADIVALFGAEYVCLYGLGFRKGFD